MKGVTFKDQTGELGRPSLMTDEECSSLPIKRITGGKYPAIESVWELSEEELQTIIKSKRVRIGILGTGMPPIYMQAEPSEI